MPGYSCSQSVAFGCIPVFFSGAQDDSYDWLWRGWRRAARRSEAEASEEPTPSPVVRRNSVGQEIRMRPKSPDVMLHAAAGPGAIWTPRQLA